MKIIIVLALVASAVFGIELNPLSDEFINYINTKQNTWTAGRNFDENTPMHELRKLLGAKKRTGNLKKADVLSNYSDIPESFDSREQWPECKDVISQIADQSHCGSCWAVSSASVMSDRRCIHSKGKLQVPVSAIDLTTCLANLYNKGCHGGFPEDAFEYWFSDGIVTGGLYNSSQGCKSYPFEHCDHYVPDSKNPCGPYSDTPQCNRECDDASLIYKDQLTFGDRQTKIFSSEQMIQAEILANGPVVSVFEVYADFFLYKSGIYQHVAGDYEGRHAVRILGWGVEKEIPYWIVANSWNGEWGDHGYFRIRRGQDEVAFEQYVVGSLPKL